MNFFIEKFIHAISSDFTANINSIIGTIIAIIGILIGGKKVTDFISAFKKKKFDAAFGYYINFETYIKRVLFLIRSDNNTPQHIIYQLSANEDLRKNETHKNNLVSKLEKLATEFLSYLSTANEQVPATKGIAEFKEWNENYSTLIEYLNWFSTIDEIYNPSLDSEEKVNQFFDKIIKVFSYFEEKIHTQKELMFREINNK